LPTTIKKTNRFGPVRESAGEYCWVEDAVQLWGFLVPLLVCICVSIYATGQ
jgi:hypothetical protein